MTTITDLLRSPVETAAQYKARYLLLTRLEPMLASLNDHPDLQALIDSLALDCSGGDTEVESQVYDHLLNSIGSGTIVDSMLAVYRLGVIMLLNPVLLHRYVGSLEALDELDQVAGLSSTQESEIDELFALQLDQLLTKARLAQTITADLLEQGVENPFVDGRLGGLKVYSADLASVRATQKQLIDTKIHALTLRDKYATRLRQVSDAERKAR